MSTKISTAEIALLLTFYFDNLAAMNAEGWFGIFAEDDLCRKSNVKLLLY